VRILNIEGNNISLSIPNKFFKDWLIENYHGIISDSLSHIMGVAVKVHFVVDQSGTHLPLSRQPESSSVNKKSASVHVHPSINQNYSFERFVVGPSNQFAHAASLSVAEQPAQNYNPLFIYGGVGLGKTHLINAIGIKTISLFPNKTVLYVSAEEFMNELINSIRYDKMPMFREKYRKIDSLLIDDIQFIAGKERTQEEFFHTFNTLHDSGKQIVVTSDKFPREIEKLEGRLRSRFEWGLIADIQPPEIETRIAIIEKKAYENNISIPNDVAHYIASVVDSNVRELEGVLTRISAYSSLTNREIEINLVKEVLINLLESVKKNEITVDEIVKKVAAKFGLKLSDLKSQKKNKDLIIPRQIAMYLSRRLTDKSFPDIGNKIGGRDHSTIVYGNNKIKKLIKTDMKLKKMIEDIEESLN
jgi:chromosomal replication initiator protein